MKRYLGSICLLGLLAILSGCVTEPSALTGESRSYGYTWQQELELGRTSDADLIQQMGLYPDVALARYVTSIGESVLAQSSLRRVGTPEIYRNLEFKFRVMDSPVVNAFALPGGYVYVTRGLLAHLSNEAQLAVVLGHEITHVAARHAS
ncbi:MAG: M48 family metalloprotease, partial [Opitutales bacterium]|nr:M48 family metalloprotease [Opitutales bacterium]